MWSDLGQMYRISHAWLIVQSWEVLPERLSRGGVVEQQLFWLCQDGGLTPGRHDLWSHVFSPSVWVCTEVSGLTLFGFVRRFGSSLSFFSSTPEQHWVLPVPEVCPHFTACAQSYSGASSQQLPPSSIQTAPSPSERILQRRLGWFSHDSISLGSWWVPKKRIGGSGPFTTTSLSSSVYSDAGQPFLLEHAFIHAGLFIAALQRSLMVVLFLALIGILSQQLVRARILPGRMPEISTGVPLRIVKCLAGTSVHSTQPLDWTPHRSVSKPKRMKTTRLSFLHRVCRWIAPFLFWHMPLCVWAAPPEVLQLCRYAMFASANNSTHRRAPVPFRHSFQTLTPDRLEAAYLGTTVYMPGYLPKEYAFRCDRARGPAVFQAQVRQCVQQDKPGLCALVPAEGQQHLGYATILAFSPDIERQDQVAVIIDLSRVGWHYYADTVKRQLRISDFLESIFRLTKDDDRQLALWVSGHDCPCRGDDLLQLQHGTVLTVLREGIRASPDIPLQALFEVDAEWGPIHHMPVAQPSTCALVITAEKQFLLDDSFFQGPDVAAALSRSLRRPVTAGDIWATEALCDVQFQGQECTQVVYVADTSAWSC